MITYDFTGQVAFVTGGSAGMGAATVRAFVEAGATVAIVDLDGDAAVQLASELTDAGGRALGIACDVSDEQQVQDLFRRTLERFGRLDALVNNAGAFEGGPLDELSAEAWDRVLVGSFSRRRLRRWLPRRRVGQPSDQVRGLRADHL